MILNSFIQTICGKAQFINGSKFLIPPFMILLVLYLIAVSKQNKRWPLQRTLFIIFAVLFVSISVIGPLAALSHIDFKIHMITHFLLGMLAPLLMVLAAPMTIFLRTLPVTTARKISLFLKKNFFRFLTHPILAALLHTGGLWLLYSSQLYVLTHENSWIHFFIHLHIFLAGYLFTQSILSIDPMPHHFSFVYRAIVMTLTFAAHGILAKYIYFHPPGGVSIEQAEQGGVLMYYGGDVIDIVIIYLFCRKWFRSNRFQMGDKDFMAKALLPLK